MKVIVTGSRDWDVPSIVWNALGIALKTADIAEDHLTVVHGACPTGADAQADAWVTYVQSQAWPVTAKSYPADWARWGRAAGPHRNRQMVFDNLDASYVLAFPRGASRGTRDTMAVAKGRGIPVINLGDK